MTGGILDSRPEAFPIKASDYPGTGSITGQKRLVGNNPRDEPITFGLPVGELPRPSSLVEHGASEYGSASQRSVEAVERHRGHEQNPSV